VVGPQAAEVLVGAGADGRIADLVNISHANLRQIMVLPTRQA